MLSNIKAYQSESLSQNSTSQNSHVVHGSFVYTGIWKGGRMRITENSFVLT